MPISLSCCKCAALFICDANTKAIGSSLNQFDSQSKTRKPLTFFSKALNPCPKHYSKYERKLLAMFLSVCHCFGFASRSRWHLITAHKPLAFAMTKMSLTMSGRQIRQLNYISQFCQSFTHIAEIAMHLHTRSSRYTFLLRNQCTASVRF